MSIPVKVVEVKVKVKNLSFHQEALTVKTDFQRGPDMEQTEYLHNTWDSTTRHEMDVKF